MLLKSSKVQWYRTSSAFFRSPLHKQVKYLNKSIHGYLKYGLPIWLTEFACGYAGEGETEEEQARLLNNSVTYLEMHPDIYRYAW